MSLLHKSFVASLLMLAALGSRARAGLAPASQPDAATSLAEVRNTTSAGVPSAYAFQMAPLDVSMPQRAIDLPMLKPLPAMDAPTRPRDRANEPPVEPVPAPNSMALGMVMLGTIAFARIVRRFKLA